jgi:GntR family transcriptional regulator, transcriptional repressor for pyruvate dehydrogenase complex
MLRIGSSLYCDYERLQWKRRQCNISHRTTTAFETQPRFLSAPMLRNSPTSHRAKTLSVELSNYLGEQIKKNKYELGSKLPKESDLMGEYGVSRTVVREAISHLQASGLVETKHGIGTFVRQSTDAVPFRVQPEQLATLRETIDLLEFRIGVEAEAAAIAATRRTKSDLQSLQTALSSFENAVSRGEDAAQADFQFHLAIATATQNSRFVEFMNALGTHAIPRARLNRIADDDVEKIAYLQRVQLEHESILAAIKNRDVEAARAAARTHLSNSRERLKRAERANDAQSSKRRA